MPGQMKNYKEALKNTHPIKVSPEVFKVRIDYRGLHEYAVSKGVSVESLSDQEKNMFILNSDMDKIRAMQLP